MKKYLFLLMIIPSLCMSQNWELVECCIRDFFVLDSCIYKCRVTPPGNAIRKSCDGGQTWTNLPSLWGVVPPYAHTYTLAFITSDIGFICYSDAYEEPKSGCFKTIDAGEHWNWIAMDGLNDPYDMTVIDDTTLVLKERGHADYWISQDQGESFSKTTLFGESIWDSKFQYFEPNIFFNLDHTNLYRSDNRGEDWHTVFESENLSSFQMMTPLKGYVFSYSSWEHDTLKVFKTEDGWNSYNTRSTIIEGITSIMVTDEEWLYAFDRYHNVFIEKEKKGIDIELVYQQKLSSGINKFLQVDEDWYAFNFYLFKLDKDGTVSVDHEPIEDIINIYPNPSQTHINIGNDDVDEYVITNKLGQVVQMGSIKEKRIEYNFTGKGIYFLQMLDSSARKSITKKLIRF